MVVKKTFQLPCSRMRSYKQDDVDAGHHSSHGAILRELVAQTSNALLLEKIAKCHVQIVKLNLPVAFLRLKRKEDVLIHCSASIDLFDLGQSQ